MKNDYFREKLEALKANRLFQQSVADLRASFKIPKKGVAKTRQAITGWLYSLPAYSEWKEGVKKLFEQSLDNYIEVLNKKVWIEDEQKRRLGGESIILGVDKDFLDSIDKIGKHFGLSESYKDYIHHYVIFNDFDYFMREKTTLHRWRFRGREPKLLLEIYPDAIGKDIIGKLDDIKKAQEELFGFVGGRKRGVEHFERDRKIYELREQGIKAEQVKDIISVERSKRKEELMEIGFKEQVVQERISAEFGEVLGYNDVYRIAKRFKRTYFGKK